MAKKKSVPSTVTEPVRMKLPRLLTVQQAGEVLGLGYTTVYALMRDGHLLRVKIGGHKTRILADSVERYVERQVRKAAPAYLPEAEDVPVRDLDAS